MRLSIFLAITLGLTAASAEEKQIEIAGAAGPGIVVQDPLPDRVGPQIVTLPEGECESELYRLEEGRLKCALGNRARILRAQRNVNLQAYRACQAQVTKLEGEIVVYSMYEEARRVCRDLGQQFDPLEADCKGSLPQPEEGDQFSKLDRDKEVTIP